MGEQAQRAFDEVLRAHRLARPSRSALARQRCFVWNDRLLSISASVGLVPITGMQTPALLLASADAACCAAKDHGRNRVQVYVPEGDLLDEHEVPGAALRFEITETPAIANLDTARALMAQPRVRGCRFALDDVGRGPSSFGDLRELPVDIVKIDGSFVRSLGDDRVREAIVRAVHHGDRSIGAQTVAESVENDRILEHARALGIDYAQGYAVGRPEPLLPHGLPPATTTLVGR